MSIPATVGSLEEPGAAPTGATREPAAAVVGQRDLAEGLSVKGGFSGVLWDGLSVASSERVVGTHPRIGRQPTGMMDCRCTRQWDEGV